MSAGRQENKGRLLGKLLRLAAAIDRLSSASGRAVSWLTLGMVSVTFLIVALRYLFDSGYIWMQESVVWMHALVFLLAAAYTLREDEHVRVDIFYRRMSPRGRAWVNLLGTLLLLVPSMLFVLITSFGFVEQAWRVQESSSEAGGLPAIYLLKSAIPAAAILILLQGFSMILRSLVRLIEKHPQAAHQPPSQGGKI